MSLLSRFSKAIEQLPATTTRLVIAYSGGLDSRVLLQLSKEYVTKHPHFTLLAIHVHHGLQEYADEWLFHCQQQAEQLSIPFVAEKLEIALKSRQSLEAVAREQRYTALAEHIDSNSCLLTGHHADDQFETFMLALKRGSGLQGLAAMPVSRSFSQGILLRPLLQSTRAELEVYAQQLNLSWIDDPSNQSLDFDRNFLRHQILPELIKRWPAWLITTQRSVQLLQESVSLHEELAELDYQQVARQHGLCLFKLKSLSLVRQKNLVRYWFAKQAWAYPSQAQLQQVLQQSQAKSDAKVAMVFKEGELRRYKDVIYLVERQALQLSSQTVDWPWQNQSCLPLPNGSCLSWQAGGNLLPPAPNQQVRVKFRDQLEQKDFSAFGRLGQRSIKKLLQECQLPTWHRARIPFVFYDQQLVAIGDCYVQRELHCAAQQGLKLVWSPIC